MTGCTSQNEKSLPEEAIFMWRKGHWHVQSGTDEHLKPVSARLAALLEDARQKGRLTEVSPGLYRSSPARPRPVRDSFESPLQRLAALKQPDGAPMLDAEQLRAGERLRRDYDTAHISPRVVASYDPAQAMGRGGRQMSDNHISALTDAALAARQRLHHALEAVGPELSGILLHVCCMTAGLEQAELRLQLPRRAGKAVLQLALTRLARHYGFKAGLRHRGPSDIGHWAVTDFRPLIAGQPAHQP